MDTIEKVQKWKGTLAERGLTTEEEKREACCYAVQEKFWVSDPDGNRWEVYTVLEDIEQKAAEGTTCCQPQDVASAPCCDPKTEAAAPCC